MWQSLAWLAFVLAPPTHMRASLNVCTYDSECTVPEVCCKGLVWDFCCYEGGTGFRLRLPAPNATAWPLPA